MDVFLSKLTPIFTKLDETVKPTSRDLGKKVAQRGRGHGLFGPVAKETQAAFF